MTRNAAPHHYLRILESWRNNTFPQAPNDIVFGLGHWKRYLGHSSVNKKLSQSSAVSYACFLANLKRALLCVSLNKGIFLSLECLPSFPGHVSPPLCSKLQYFSAEDSWQSSLLNCSVCTSLSRLIFEQYWSTQTVVRFLVCLRSTLFSTTCSPNLPFLLKKISNFFDRMTR